MTTSWTLIHETYEEEGDCGCFRGDHHIYHIARTVCPKGTATIVLRHHHRRVHVYGDREHLADESITHHHITPQELITWLIEHSTPTAPPA